MGGSDDVKQRMRAGLAAVSCKLGQFGQASKERISASVEGLVGAKHVGHELRCECMRASRKF